MARTCFRRYRMEIDLRKTWLPAAELPPGYGWVAWDPTLVPRHALVKYESFREEVDARVFPCLGDIVGCQRLMEEISTQKNFLPEATWLIGHREEPMLTPLDCGTIQGIGQSRSVGAVQNVGVVPDHRGRGLGRALVLKALQGFQQRGLRRVYLEVTASNAAAVRLYRSIGFRLRRTLYKVAEAPPVVSS